MNHPVNLANATGDPLFFFLVFATSMTFFLTVSIVVNIDQILLCQNLHNQITSRLALEITDNHCTI